MAEENYSEKRTGRSLQDRTRTPPTKKHPEKKEKANAIKQKPEMPPDPHTEGAGGMGGM